jgi:hypothetical protein
LSILTSTNPLSFIPLPHHFRVTLITYSNLLLHASEDRSTIVTNIAPAGHHFDPDKIPVTQEPGEWIDAKWLAVLSTLSAPLYIFA